MNCKQEYIRKLAAGIYAYRNFLQKQREEYEPSAGELDQATELENKEYSYRRAKIRMQDQRRMVNKGLREWARAERLEEVVQEAVQQLKYELPLTLPEIVCASSEETEAALLLSDWHVGMRTDNIVNQFNTAVLNQRVSKLTEEVAQKVMNIKRLHVFCLGDLVHGLIHVTARIDQEEDVVHQCMIAGELLAQMLNRLSISCPVTLYWSRGNHERISANKKESICRESFADLILWFLKARLADNYRVSFYENTVDDEIILTKICGHTCIAVHGHKDKPAKAVQNLSLLLRVFPDYIFMGHFHAAAERDIQGAEVIINGSLCGTDDYALSLRRTSKPTQKLLFFTEQGCDMDCNISLD